MSAELEPETALLVLLFVIVGVIWLSFKPVLAHASNLCIFYTAGVGEIGENRSKKARNSLFPQCK